MHEILKEFVIMLAQKCHVAFDNAEEAVLIARESSTLARDLPTTVQDARRVSSGLTLSLQASGYTPRSSRH